MAYNSNVAISEVGYKKMTMNKDYSKLINVFEGDSVVKRLREIYLYRTIPEIFGICRSELAHSSFLAWLFNPFANDFGKEPLLLLLILCNKKRGDHASFFVIQLQKMTRYAILHNIYDQNPE